MKNVTKKMIETNYIESFSKLLAELLQDYPIVKDFYYSEHWGCQAVYYVDGDDNEFDTFLYELGSISEKQKHFTDIRNKNKKYIFYR